MTAQKKGTIIGTDAFFRELAVGDEIQDLDGRHYTIDQFGRCKPLDGGNAVPLRNVKEPDLVTKYAGPKPAKTKEAMSKARNKSGTCMICNLVRRMPISGAAARKILEDFGMEVFSDDAGRACIKRDDFSVAQKLLQDWCKARGEDAEHQDQPAAVFHPFPPQPSQEALDAIKTGTLGEHLEIRPRIEGFSDQALADELRRRGYTVTAVKHIEL